MFFCKKKNMICKFIDKKVTKNFFFYIFVLEYQTHNHSDMFYFV